MVDAMRYHLTVPALVFVVAASVACGTSGPPEAAPTAAPLAVNVASAALVDRPDVFRAGGTLRGGQSALVSSRVMATVRTVAITRDETSADCPPRSVPPARNTSGRSTSAADATFTARGAAVGAASGGPDVPQATEAATTNTNAGTVR